MASLDDFQERSGVSVLNSIDVLTATIENVFFRKQFAGVKDKLKAGEGMTEALRGVKYFSPLALSLVMVGERSGNFEAMMDELSSHYDQEVEFQVEKMTEYIGPVLILCLGVIVLFFALAVFLPMWDMVKFVK